MTSHGDGAAPIRVTLYHEVSNWVGRSYADMTVQSGEQGSIDHVWLVAFESLESWSAIPLGLSSPHLLTPPHIRNGGDRAHRSERLTASLLSPTASASSGEPVSCRHPGRSATPGVGRLGAWRWCSAEGQRGRYTYPDRSDVTTGSRDRLRPCNSPIGLGGMMRRYCTPRSGGAVRVELLGPCSDCRR